MPKKTMKTVMYEKYGSPSVLNLTEWLEQGKIKPLIDRCFTLNNMKEAHQYVESGHKSGSVVIAVSAKEREKWNEQK